MSMLTLWLKVKSLFHRHELWALRKSVRFPLLSQFFFVTLWSWAVIPVLVSLPTFALLLAPLLAEEPSPFVGISLPVVSIACIGVLAGSVVMVPWFLRWNFACIELTVIGSSGAAERRMSELEKRFSETGAEEGMR